MYNGNLITIFTRHCYCHLITPSWKQERMHLPNIVGKHIGRIVSLNGTLSLRRSSAISFSKFRKLKSPVITRTTYLVSGPFSIHLSCSPKVTLIMNHMNLKIRLEELITFVWRIRLQWGNLVKINEFYNKRKFFNSIYLVLTELFFYWLNSQVLKFLHQ